ncbi:complement component C1q receptor isoform X2 [Rhea pennata]|uniref:complement component C1q receptor isoform X2 n=1 Tax=Rhea pennata TaxID=8795 RepID=UPI002E262884
MGIVLLPPRLLLLLAPALFCGTPGCAVEHAEVLCAETACYTLHGDKLAWSGAQEKCQKNGGNLAAIRSLEEAQHVQELLSRSHAGAGWQGKVWIGLSREKGKCVQSHDPLRGFAWAGSGEKTNYSAWLAEPHTTCLSHRCASLQPAGPSSPTGWADGPCRVLLSGYVCKFSFQGMCAPLVLGGPGAVTYMTPFSVESATLAAVPFGTLAQVTCGADEPEQHFMLCKEREPAGGFTWHCRGPRCASCTRHDDSCEGECVEVEQGAPPCCACPPGYALDLDLASCLPADSCRPNPCEGPCRRLPDGGFECGCADGYVLAPDGQRCLDVDECLGQPCHQECRNMPGGFACTCHLGYEPEAPGSPRCHDVDECAATTAACPPLQLCLNVPGSFLCACRPGYQRDTRQEACVDVDECLRRPCPDTCLNMPGSYRCTCPPGFVSAVDGSACRPDSPGTEGLAGTSWPTHPPLPALPARPPGSSVQPAAAAATSAAATTTTAAAATTAASTASPGPGSARDAEHTTDGPKLLLYYILGSLVVILLMMAFTLALLAYRRRKAKEEKEQAKSAADDYRWVPEQAESSTAGSEFRNSRSLSGC